VSALSEQALVALRRAAATRPDIARLVLVERRVEPRSEEPFTDLRLVVVLDDPPTEPPGFEPLRELVRQLASPLRERGGYAISVPSALGMESATSGGVVVYERDVAP
jgi:hypothetical protein